MNYTLGIDISKYQGTMDFAVARSAGAQFAFVRAGGAYKDTLQPFTDSRWPENLARLTNGDFPWAPFWYFVPKNVQAQADYYLNLIQFQDWWMPPAVDCEYDAGLSSSAYSDALEQFLGLLHAGLGEVPIIYTRGEWWNTNTAARASWPQHDLWIARYAALNHPWGDGLFKPRDWADFCFWQFSADGNGRAAEFGSTGGDADIDLDYFNGDHAAFYAYLGITEPIAYPYMVRVIDPLNALVREQPKAGQFLRVEPQGAGLAVFGAQEDVDGAIWLDIGNGFVRESMTEKI